MSGRKRGGFSGQNKINTDKKASILLMGAKAGVSATP